jgi:hypothetical protein
LSVSRSKQVKETQRAHVEARGDGVGDDALHVERLAVVGVEAARGDAAHERVAAVDVIDEHAVAAALEVVADAGHGGVEETAAGGLRRGGAREWCGGKRGDGRGAEEIAAGGAGRRFHGDRSLATKRHKKSEGE